jgi:hypothetical protein
MLNSKAPTGNSVMSRRGTYGRHTYGVLYSGCPVADRGAAQRIDPRMRSAPQRSPRGGALQVQDSLDKYRQPPGRDKELETGVEGLKCFRCLYGFRAAANAGAGCSSAGG